MYNDYVNLFYKIMIFFLTISSSIILQEGYWDFTYSEMATYDLRAFLNFVYLETGQKVHYIGHSQVYITTTLLCARLAT